MKTPPIVSAQEWEAAHQEMLVKEKELTRARDALAAMRRRMPWTPVEKRYEFEGPEGKASLLDLFHGRRQLIIYRAFVEPGIDGWPDHGCVGCSLMADHIGHLAHLNARDTTLVYASRAPQADIERVKARMGWEIPWYTITDGFDADFGVRPMARHQRVHPRRRPGVPHLLHQQPRRRGVREYLELPRHDRARASGEVGGLPGGLPADQAVRMVGLARRIRQTRALAVVRRPRPQRPQRPTTAAPARTVIRVSVADPRLIARLYQETRERIIALVTGLDDAAWSTAVAACPGWSVRDVVAHLAAVAEDWVSGRLAGPPTDEETAAQIARFGGLTWPRSWPPGPTRPHSWTIWPKPQG